MWKSTWNVEKCQSFAIYEHCMGIKIGSMYLVYKWFVGEKIDLIVIANSGAFLHLA